MITRRTFLGRSAAAAGLPLLWPGVARGRDRRPAPSERIAVGCIGAGGQGNYVLAKFLRNANAQVVALCDVKKERRESTREAVDRFYDSKGCAVYEDFREMLARTDIDAVLIASPDHWHVLHGLATVRSGKDLYLEKPLGLSLAEDQALRDAVRLYGRVFQFGTQQRSSREFWLACELVRSGRIGEVHTIRVGAPGSVARGTVAPRPVPEGIDYDSWLGPAPFAPYSPERVTNQYWYHISDYALGFVAGWGIHHLDIAQWGMGGDNTGPVKIEGTGEFPEDGICDCATAWDVEMRYDSGMRLHYTDNGKNPQGVIFEGSEGRVHVRRGHIETEPASLASTAFDPAATHLEQSPDHVGNFLDCVRSRARPVSHLETAVRSDTLCHLSDIAMRVGRPLRWDPVAESFPDDVDARRFLIRSMRSPWHL